MCAYVIKHEKRAHFAVSLILQCNKLLKFKSAVNFMHIQFFKWLNLKVGFLSDKVY